MTTVDDLIGALAPLAAAKARCAPPRLSAGRASVVVDVTGLEGGEQAALEADVRGALAAVPGVTEVRILLTAERRGPRLLVVGSGKGGVGKSTVSANLAIALAHGGLRVGLVDADIYGPSQPTLLGVSDAKPRLVGETLQPTATAFGITMLSIGQMVAPGKALAWRGAMVGKALDQLLNADWGDRDIVVVDLPPGTGDVQLSIIQKHRPAGAIIVSTPQDLALIDARRAIDLFDTAGVPVIGLVENMAGYRCPHCGAASDPFGQGGAERLAGEHDVPLLGRIPLTLELREASDAGRPPAAGTGPTGAAFEAVATKVRAWLEETYAAQA